MNECWHYNSAVKIRSVQMVMSVCVSHSSIWLRDHLEISGRAQAKKPETNYSGQILDESSTADID